MASKSDMELLEKEANEALELARKAESQEPAPAPAPEPSPAPAPNAELDELRKQLEAATARNAELTAKLNAEDGRRGGELRTLRESVEQMRAQMQAMADENKRLAEAAAKPAAPTEPEVDPEEDKSFNEHFPTLAKRQRAEAEARKAELDRIRKEALEAKQKAEALERQSMTTATQRFASEVKAKVPTFLEVIKDPAFNAWANATRIKGTPMTYGESYDNAAATLNADQAIEVLEAYALSKQPSTPAEPATDEKPKPPKPSKEGQATPASDTGAAPSEPTPDPMKDKAKRAARTKELEYKVFESRTATMAERAELEKLIREDG